MQLSAISCLPFYLGPELPDFHSPGLYYTYVYYPVKPRLATLRKFFVGSPQTRLAGRRGGGGYHGLVPWSVLLAATETPFPALPLMPGACPLEPPASEAEESPGQAWGIQE